MRYLILKIILAAVSVVVGYVATSAALGHEFEPVPLLSPGHDDHDDHADDAHHDHDHEHLELPRLGFAGKHVFGHGIVVQNVLYHSEAKRLGLQPGDIIAAVNGVPLQHGGAWNHEIAKALQYKNGFVKLTIRDVNSGLYAQRTTRMWHW